MLGRPRLLFGSLALPVSVRRRRRRGRRTMSLRRTAGPLLRLVMVGRRRRNNASGQRRCRHADGRQRRNGAEKRASGHHVLPFVLKYMNFLGLYLTGSIAGSIVNHLFQNEGSGVRFFSASVGGRQSDDPGDSGLCCQRRRTTRPKLPVFGGIIISVEDFAWSLIIVKDAKTASVRYHGGCFCMRINPRDCRRRAVSSGGMTTALRRGTTPCIRSHAALMPLSCRGGRAAWGAFA